MLSKKRHSRSPRFEQLEDRQMLAGTIAAGGVPFASAAGIAEADNAYIGTPVSIPAPTAASKQFYVGTFHDVNKSGNDDSLLCWAASTANIVAYTSWGLSSAASCEMGNTPLFSTDYDLFDYYIDNFPDEGGYVLSAISWFVNGVYYDIYAPNPDGDGGLLYPGLSGYDLENQRIWTAIGAPGETMMGKMAGQLEWGYGVSVGIGFYTAEAPVNKFGGHAITAWGYTYNPDLDPSDPAFYTGLLITDSDDNRTQMITCSIEWHDEYHLYRLSGYGAGTAWLEYFVTLKPTRPLTGVTLTGYNGPCDGQPHGVTIGGLDFDNSDQYSILYTTNGISSETAPSFTRPGSNTVTVVIVKNDYEAIWSAPVTVTITEAATEPLPAPTISSVVSAGINRHTVSWTPVDGAAGYELTYSADGGQSWTSAETAETNLLVGGLTYGKTLLYRVRALGDDIKTKTSGWSAEKSLLVNPSDLDGDGFIGPGDLSLLSSTWFTADGTENWDPRADIDGDGFIGPGDSAFLRENWFKTAASADTCYPAVP